MGSAKGSQSQFFVNYINLFTFLLQDSAAPEGTGELSIEKLETQLNTLKTMFAEKQRLVADLEVYGAGGATLAAGPQTASATPLEPSTPTVTTAPVELPTPEETASA